jgi:AraC-like DNA-binding protein
MTAVAKASRFNHESENWVRRAPGALDRIEARFAGAAFAPHRHDTYAIGITLAGVQSFDYRGSTRHSLPGHIVVLHPDELHDGRAGTDAGFHYRTVYLEPSLLQTVLGGRPLPFVDEGVSTDQALRRALLPLIEDYHRPLCDLVYQDALYELAAALSSISEGPEPIAVSNYDAAQEARAYLDAHLEEDVALEDLEVIAGYDRWQLSRDFRAVFGTSPYRYLILRRLDKARSMMRAGQAIADVAAACTFSDQSHFTRQFKKTFGLTPRAWLAVMR